MAFKQKKTYGSNRLWSQNCGIFFLIFEKYINGKYWKKKLFPYASWSRNGGLLKFSRIKSFVKIPPKNRCNECNTTRWPSQKLTKRKTLMVRAWTVNEWGSNELCGNDWCDACIRCLFYLSRNFTTKISKDHPFRDQLSECFHMETTFFFTSVSL